MSNHLFVKIAICLLKYIFSLFIIYFDWLFNALFIAFIYYFVYSIILINMNKSISGQLFDIEKENIIWLIYLFIIGANFISNYFEEKYLYTVDDKYRKIFRYINILVLFIALCIYIYTTYVTYKSVKKNSPTYRKLLLLASICILIGGAIYLYVEVYKNANPEIDII